MKEIQIYISAIKIIPYFFLRVKILFVILQIFVEFYFPLKRGSAFEPTNKMKFAIKSQEVIYNV
jgi:hypothetical protein